MANNRNQNKNGKKKISKSQRVEQARRKAAEIREKKRAEKRKQRILVLVIVSVIVIAAVAVIIALYSHVQSLPKDFTESKGEEADISNMTSVPHPSNLTEDGGIMVSKNGFNKPVEGAVKVDNFSDFGCIACRIVDTKIKPDIENYIKEGKINFVVHPVATPWLASTFTDGYTTRMTQAAYYIYQNDPEHFLDFFYGIFEDTSLPIDQLENQKSGAYPFSDAKIQEFAAKVGVKTDVAQKCTDGEYNQFVQAGAAYVSGLADKAKKENIQFGTPYFLVNGERVPQGSDILSTIKVALGGK
jgi:protein-disulfide isomerase